jgi:hypothetical protein
VLRRLQHCPEDLRVVRRVFGVDDQPVEARAPKNFGDSSIVERDLCSQAQFTSPQFLP